MEMGLKHTSLLVVLCFVNVSQSRSSSQYGPLSSNPEQEWNKLALDDERALAHGPRSKSSSRSSVAQERKVPTYLTVSADMVQKKFFKPEKGFRSLPSSVVEILRATPSPASPSTPANSKKNIEVLCHIDRMYVRIKKELFNNRYAYRLLKLGTCPVNKDDKDYYYFLHLLKTDCGFKTEVGDYTMNIKITLHYKPPQSKNRWIRLREMPFSISLQWFNSYMIGFHPKLMGGTVFKQLTQKSNFLLIAQDASGDKLTGSKVYTLGQTMYFAARRADSIAVSDDERIYINKCSVTTSQDPNSSPKVVNPCIVSICSCMTDGKLTRRSRFLPCASKKIQRFSLGTFVFQDKISGSTSQVCQYELVQSYVLPCRNVSCVTRLKCLFLWKELYGDDAVCACCEKSTCSAQIRGKMFLFFFFFFYSFSIKGKGKTVES
uniref:ZP domain-containing protein n=1 Tax=Sphaeramia orbicularis TaxID=375764 RepID=A0A673CES8_9TELE